jgi:predicted GNAT family N-acyltransferase
MTTSIASPPKHRRRGISSVYALAESVQPERILGYCTLSAAEVKGQRLTEAERKKLTRNPMRWIRVGRLACRMDQRGRGLGELLPGCAVDRRLKARQQVAAYALPADARDDLAKAFYVHFGFKSLQDSPLALYLPLGR